MSADRYRVVRTGPYRARPEDKLPPEPYAGAILLGLEVRYNQLESEYEAVAIWAVPLEAVMNGASRR